MHNDKLRIMTYNVHEWKDSGAITIIENCKPDVLFVQEGVDILFEQLNSYFAMDNFTIFGNVFGCKADANLYNYVYIKSNIDAKVLFNGETGEDDRCSLILLCKRGDYRFILINTHLSDTFEFQESNVNVLLDELQRIVKKYNLEGVDIILGGDFNSYDRESLKVNEIKQKKREYYSKKDKNFNVDLLYASVDKLKEYGFVDSYRIHGGQHRHNKPYFVPSHTSLYSGKVDYIFVNREFSRPILGCYQIMDNSSDHTPLVIDILIESQMPKINLLNKDGNIDSYD